MEVKGPGLWQAYVSTKDAQSAVGLMRREFLDMFGVHVRFYGT